MPEIIHQALPGRIKHDHPDDTQSNAMASYFTQAVVDAETKAHMEAVNQVVQQQQLRAVPQLPPVMNLAAVATQAAL